MQASLTRWAVVTFCTLGAVGCQGTKPGWWPGQKGPVYSNASSTPPAGVPQQAPPQQQGYMDQANNYGQTGGAPAYQPGAGGYPIGNANPQDPYGMAGAAATPGSNPYDQAYAQQQQQATGAYPEQYPGGAASYGQPGAQQGGYADPQGAGGYGQGQGYQAGANPYGGAAANPGYDPVRAADARYQAGAPAGGQGGYGTNSPYDAGGAGGYPAQDPYNQAAPAGGYQQGAAPAEQPYQPGNTGYQPGNTGYAPAGTTPYQAPAGAYNGSTSGAGQVADAPYRPGSTSDYLPTGSGAANTAAAGYSPAATATSAPAAATAPAGYGAGATARYPSTAGAGGSAASPQLDRYGRPIPESAGGYGNDANLQR